MEPNELLLANATDYYYDDMRATEREKIEKYQA
jgi:hypothetical protein